MEDPSTRGKNRAPAAAERESQGQGGTLRESGDFSEEVEVRGHIIDSLILPKILDLITAGGGAFAIKHITI